MTAASFWLAAHCIGKFRKRRYLQYLLAIGTRQVCAIDVLAKAVNKSTKFVIRDLKSMIKTGLFPQGHLDAENTCLIPVSYTHLMRIYMGTFLFFGAQIACQQTFIALDVYKRQSPYGTKQSALSAEKR